MSLNDLFVASALTWFNNDGQPQRLIRDMDAVLHDSRPERVIEFRADFVADYRGLAVHASAERLVRWDDRPPSVIFRDGFLPWYRPAQGDQLNLDRMDLETYVSGNERSIFVGTARYYRQNNRVMRWVPRVIADRYEYEVYAFGGIDVNLSLGGSHRYWNQREIAFPGGIRPEFIRTAREHDADGRVVRIWANAGFDVSASGIHHSPRLPELPDAVHGASVEVVYWFGQDESDGLFHRAPRSANETDPMREEGEPKEDDLASDAVVGHPPRACFTVPETKDTYFFGGTQYAHIGVAEDTVISGRKNICEEWQSLKQARFATVDAVMPVPSISGEAYFFCGKKYVRIEVKPNASGDRIVSGPFAISDQWASLREAGFETVDAVLPVAARQGQEAYMFSGSKYVRVGIKPGTLEDSLLAGPQDIDWGWKSLKKAGFSTLDSALPVPGVQDDAYFFSGTYYARIKFHPTAYNDELVGSGVSSTRENWKSLVETLIY